MSDDYQREDIRHEATVASERDRWLMGAMREGTRVDEEGAWSSASGPRYRVVEESIRIELVRTWRLEYCGDEPGGGGE